MIRPKQLTCIGEFHLQEAVLDVLCDNQPEGWGLGAAEISRRAGIYRESDVIQMNDAIASGLLNQLHEQGRVEQHDQENGRGGWRLTEREYERRRDDIERR